VKRPEAEWSAGALKEPHRQHADGRDIRRREEVNICNVVKDLYSAPSRYVLSVAKGHYERICSVSLQN